MQLQRLSVGKRVAVKKLKAAGYRGGLLSNRAGSVSWPR